jgi:hypothetical protein
VAASRGSFDREVDSIGPEAWNGAETFYHDDESSEIAKKDKPKNLSSSAFSLPDKRFRGRPEPPRWSRILLEDSLKSNGPPDRPMFCILAEKASFANTAGRIPS